MTSHEGYVIQNPDGSSAVLVPEVKPPLHPMNPPAMAQLPNPYAQLDALAQQELARMRKQDNSDLAALSTTPKASLSECMKTLSARAFPVVKNSSRPISS